MKRKNVTLLWFIIVGLVSSEAQAQVAVPQGPSVSQVMNKVLFVARRVPLPSPEGSLSAPVPYVIKGVSWQPATRAPATGPNPLNPAQNVPYGFFFDHPEVMIYWLKNEPREHVAEDLPLLRQMNVNTMRAYNDFGLNPALFTGMLDEFYRQGIMVILTVANSKAEIDAQTYLSVVEQYKNHPAILMWSIGNEWNLSYNLFFGYPSVKDARDAVNRVAGEIKAADPNHAVSSVLGDRFSDAVATNTIRDVVRNSPNVDLWGLNIYRGTSFGTLFTQWAGLWAGMPPKPFYLSEFGTDSFKTTAGKFTIVEGRADNIPGQVMGVEDEALQANTDIGLWNQIKARLSRDKETEYCVGGLVHEFNDELWKVGNYHVGLGGLNDSPTSYNQQDPEGLYLPGAHPDNVNNEEFYGMVKTDSENRRVPKEAFARFSREFAVAFIRGDANSDGLVNITDAIFILEYLFKGNAAVSCLDSADINDDGTVDLSDAVKLLFVLFAGAAMPAPADACGVDPTPYTSLGCIQFDAAASICGQ